MSVVRVLLADDHTLVRAGLRALVETLGSVQIVAEASSGRDAVAFAVELRPDLVLMDISMGGLNGIDATLELRDKVPGARVLILSMHTTEDFVRRALKAGASGYLVKDSAPLELRLAIEAVMRGEVFISSRVSRHVVSGLVEGRDEAHALDLLSPRQRQILQLLAEGHSTKEIAAQLALSVKTIEAHRAALTERLGIRDLAGLVLFAARHHLVSLERPEN